VHIRGRKPDHPRTLSPEDDERDDEGSARWQDGRRRRRLLGVQQRAFLQGLVTLVTKPQRIREVRFVFVSMKSNKGAIYAHWTAALQGAG
jgi:hypothetical protein